jgi:hypothetical protein
MAAADRPLGRLDHFQSIGQTKNDEFIKVKATKNDKRDQRPDGSPRIGSTWGSAVEVKVHRPTR